MAIVVKKMQIKRQKQKFQGYRDYINDVPLEMVLIPSGTFTMGAPETEEGSRDNERPQRNNVKISSFLMGRYPVTQAQWRAIASRTDLKKETDLEPDPSYFKGDDRPVESVNWYEAVEFCQRLSKLTGRDYRLPSESEWEYACRAGTTTPFHFGETITTDLANYRGKDNEALNWSGSYGKGPKGEYREETTPVNHFKVVNLFGLSDMHGNVWEWCADDWHENYKGAPDDGSAWLDGDKDRSPVRGGAWDVNPVYCRSASRYYYVRVIRDDDFGFRIVCGFGRTH